jgi:5-methyltetrahydrofolate--homocysteine methyltransferase
METIISSHAKEVRIGGDHPFVLIGERINPTGRKKLAAELAVGNFDRIREDALAQVAAGAQMLDVNAGIPMIDEPAVLAEIVQLVQGLVDVPLAIDSSLVAALESGLSVYQGKALVNSVTGEDERLEAVLPLVKKYKAAVIGIAHDETGISHDPDVRFAAAQKIIQRAEVHGIPREDVIIDPLAMPVAAVPSAGASLLQLTRRIREELGVNTTCGASNISFGLPGRPALNAAFIAMAIAAGMTCAITNPLEEQIVSAIRGANVLLGHDEYCGNWIRAYKVTETSGSNTGDVPARRARPRRESI